ncbi:transposase (plasmid) [Deinococcus sp. D7000]|nr:transposase [Deinococcus sp. D7000]
MEVKDVLREVMARRGSPALLRSENGSEFIARDLGIWLAVHDIGTRFIELGKPWLQRLRGKLPTPVCAQKVSGEEVFYSAKHAQVLLDDWRAFYNARRPHSSLGYRTPDEVAEQARGRPTAPLGGNNTAKEAVSPSPR